MGNSEAGEPSSVAGGGAADTGQICPGANAAGLPTSDIAQTDELSGGQTVTEVADVADTSPMEGETVYGAFTALAEASDGVSPIGVTITNGNGTVVFSSDNIDTTNGASVPALTPGNYTATWTVSDPNGDTRTVTTRFIEQAPIGAQGPQGPQGAQGRRALRVRRALRDRREHKVRRARKDLRGRRPRSRASWSSTTRSTAR